jgi:acetolactate synthase-1/2/3 large subunit
MLREMAPPSPVTPAAAIQAHPGAADMARVRDLLAAAERPLVMLGGGGWSAEACGDIRTFAEANDLPVTCSFRCQDLFDNAHANYAGDVAIGINPKLAARVRDTDLLLAIGPRLGEMTTSGYTLLDIPVPAQQLVHVHAGAEELGRVYIPSLAINAGMGAFAAAAAEMDPVSGGWGTWTASAHADYVEWNRPTENPGPLQLAEIMDWLGDNLPDGAIVSNGAGNYSAWVHRFYRYGGFRSQLGPTSGSMGYGVPAAISAKRHHPERTVVAFAGDGCFQMTGQELATAVQYGINVIIIVVNNAMYGTIRMHQERNYPGRVSGTDLVNPDFAALAEAYGAQGERVERTEDFADAFGRALAAGRPALIELALDPEAISPAATLSQLRQSKT